MSENSRRYLKSIYILDAVAKRVPPSAWDNQSCCSEWTARQVAGHAASVMGNVAALAGSADPPFEGSEAEIAGDDPAATIGATVDRVAEALDQQGVLASVAATPFGEMPLDDFIGILWVDSLTHAWDIADAAGIPHGIEPELGARAKATLEPMEDALRGSGRFADAVEPSASDPVSEFIAFSGRSPVSA